MKCDEPPSATVYMPHLGNKPRLCGLARYRLNEAVQASPFVATPAAKKQD